MSPEEAHSGLNSIIEDRMQLLLQLLREVRNTEAEMTSYTFIRLAREQTDAEKLWLKETLASVLLWARDEFYRYEEEMYQEREATAQDIDAGKFITRLAEEIIKE